VWERYSIKLRIFFPLSLLMALTLGGALLTVWYSYRIDGLFSDVLHRHIDAYHSAAALENALVNQKGYVSYFFQDGDPAWLEQMAAYRRRFRELLDDARKDAETPRLKQALDDIGRGYDRYVAEKNRVIELYRSDQFAEGQSLHQDVRTRFFHTLELCERFKEIHNERIVAVQAEVHYQAGRLRLICLAGVAVMGGIGLVLFGVIGFQILRPLNRLATMTRRGASPSDAPQDLVQRLSRSVEGLIADAGERETELERSRESLLQAEKLAMVGKLAAGVAHSVRNPLTSVKMRLFSLDRSLALTPDQREDFDVISEEIRHVDAIVGNFLEFSRPPKLAVQRISPSAVVDQSVQLLTHRLKSYEVAVAVKRDRPLDPVSADPEQLKEVIVNIIINACEAMGDGGGVTIRETTQRIAGRDFAEIAIADTGPGIPEDMLQRVFEPFYTTKEDGTGLGLSIVDRIVREHGGRVDVASAPGQGTTFTLRLPLEGR
jgi:signal transduction histidine kinase